jgi:hypothetical protein
MNRWRRCVGALVIGGALGGWAVPATAATLTCTVTDPSADPNAGASVSRTGNQTTVSLTGNPGAGFTPPHCTGS